MSFIHLDENTLVVGAIDAAAYLSITRYVGSLADYPWTKKYPDWFYDTVFMLHHRTPIINLSWDEFKDYYIKSTNYTDAPDEVLKYLFSKYPKVSYTYVPYAEIADKLDGFNPYKVVKGEDEKQND